MDGLKDSLWLVWIGGALLAGLLEIASLDFVFAMFVGGALVASLTAALGYSFTVQVVTFAVTSTVLLVTVRPAVKRWATRNVPFVPTNVHALAGQRAQTLTEITHQTGSVKLTGETWSARTEQAGVVIPPGAPVEVVAIDGATAVVRDATPQDRSTSPPA